MMPTLALLVLIAAAMLPASASAAGVTTERVCTGDKSCAPVMVLVKYAAAPGEANDLAATVKGRGVLVRDRAPMIAGRGCDARADGAVACVGDLVMVNLGDGADQMVADGDPSRPSASVTFHVDGGAGDDVLAGGGALSGGPGRDRLTGGGGHDRLTGGEGEDRLAGGAGDDWLIGDGGRFSEPVAPAADVLDGGGGANTVDYGGHTAPVHLDLAAQAGGAAGEADRLSGVVHAQGGQAGDVLVGDGRANRLDGNGGHDTITGREGDDELSGSGRLDGGPGDDEVEGHNLGAELVGGAGDDYLSGVTGRDRYAAGPGADVVRFTHGGEREARLRCGRGRDVVHNSELARVPIGCERIAVFGAPVAAHPRRLGGGRLRVSVPRRSRARQELQLRRVARGRPRDEPFARRRVPAGRRRVQVVVPRALRRRPLTVQLCVVRSFGAACWVVELDDLGRRAASRVAYVTS